MTRLIAVVEGQTEAAFVRDVLAPHLDDLGVWTSATVVGRVIAERRGHRERGGGSFGGWRADLVRCLRNDRSDDLRVTTMFDLYVLLPDFPGVDSPAVGDASLRCEALEDALAAAIGDRRLIPYVQRDEFEALVLAALPSLRGLLDADDDLEGVDALAREVHGLPPEDVNGGQETAPSKRILRCVPGYSKTLHGPLVTLDAGLVALRAACPRFGTWVARLEALGA